jgi:hypothetical protein
LTFNSESAFALQVYPCLKRELLSSETLLPEVRAHLHTYSEFVHTVNSYPRGAAFRDVSHQVCVQLQAQVRLGDWMNALKIWVATTSTNNLNLGNYSLSGDIYL